MALYGQSLQTVRGLAGVDVNARVVALRRLLHERAEQGRAASAAELANAGDAIRLRAELAQLANRLSGEMAEVLTCSSCAMAVCSSNTGRQRCHRQACSRRQSLIATTLQQVRDFVTSETTDICAFVEERIEEALQQAAAQASQPRAPLQQERQLGGEAAQPSSGPLTVSVLRSAPEWGSSSAPAAVMWSPTSSARGSLPDAAVAAEVPRSMQDLWHHMQRGMHRLEVRLLWRVLY